MELLEWSSAPLRLTDRTINLHSKSLKSKTLLGRATIPTRGQINFAHIRPLIGMLPGFPHYFGSLLLSLSRKKENRRKRIELGTKNIEKVIIKYVIPRNEGSPQVAPHSNLKKINTRKVIARNEATTRSKSNLKKP